MNRYDEFREQVLDAGHSFVRSAVLQAAFELDLFEAMAEESKTAATIAGEIGAEPRALEILLNAMAGMNFVRKTGNSFSLSEAGKYVFLKKSEKYIGDIVKHQKAISEGFSRLSEAVRKGGPLVSPSDRPERTLESAGDFTRAMHNSAVGHAELLSKKIDLSGVRTLLDMGGGSGAFSIYFLKQNPELRATIFDLPTTIEWTKQFVAQYGFGERVSYQGGDFEVDAIQGAFDVIFLSHIVHSLNEEKNEALFKKLFEALNPGGRLIVQDFFLNDDKMSPQYPALFALNMLLHTEGGRSYSWQEAKSWALKAGFRNAARPPLRLPRGIVLLIAYK